ncbi:acyl-CoA dehydrogenase family protein [Ureibacillus sp. FSL K6-8385]|uniref:Acyl-CoA dehydrogenase n=1 Tax=Ureibacillus terrenus TaxID=118246 RepID=A0A540UWG0_9BACL|nr:acyl-CoA dehydrogenase family protein [Ureibacillus terrenus]MED3765004.1 acyl-CoA/acyl-ACP dehydrogenase [Ureibacillus terrenus]TQE88840.1 acyl-CoA dehydrogenase [Ureibacillus terrenus]
MSEMKEMILDVAERMLEDHVTKDVVDVLEKGEWAKDVWKLFEDNGMISVAVPEEKGGAGGDLEDLLNLVRLTGKYAAPIPFAETTFANFLLETGNLETVDQVATYSLQEGLSLQNGQISGTLDNVPWARHAKHLVALVQKQIALIDLADATIQPGSNMAGEPRDTVILNNAKVQSSSLLTDEQIFHLKSIETAFKIALMTGAIEKINQLSVQYSKEREQFGRPIHRFQLVQYQIAQLAGETAIALAAFNNVCAAVQSDKVLHEIAFARIRFEDAITTVTAVSHQLHAAIGTTHEHALHQYTRRLWSWRDEGTSADYWSGHIADYLLNHDDDLWAYLTKTTGAAVKN